MESDAEEASVGEGAVVQLSSLLVPLVATKYLMMRVMMVRALPAPPAQSRRWSLKMRRRLMRRGSRNKTCAVHDIKCNDLFTAVPNLERA